MEIFDAARTAALLPYGPLAQAIAQTLRDNEAGLIQAPERLVLPLPTNAADAPGKSVEPGVLLLMPASDQRLAITKILTVHPDNPAQDLPTIQAEVLVMRAADGQRLGLLDGPTVTARRTAALSLLAAQVLAPRPRGPLLVVGAGVQARAHLEAFAELKPERAFVASRTLAKAEALAARGRELGLDCQAVDMGDGPSKGPNQGLSRELLARCSLVVTATTSLTPVLPGNAVELPPRDAFIAAVGAFKPHMAELPPELVHAAKIYVCTLEGARSEAGDLLQAKVDWSAVTPLAKALDGPRPESGPVVFKSVGHSLFDLAAARLAFA